MARLSVCIKGMRRSPSPARWAPPAHAVDMRIYWARLLEDFSSRGGRVVIRTVESNELESVGVAPRSPGGGVRPRQPVGDLSASPRAFALHEPAAPVHLRPVSWRRLFGTARARGERHARIRRNPGGADAVVRTRSHRHRLPGYSRRAVRTAQAPALQGRSPRVHRHGAQPAEGARADGLRTHRLRSGSICPDRWISRMRPSRRRSVEASSSCRTAGPSWRSATRTS